MLEIGSPFVGKPRSSAEITAESTEKRLQLLLGIYKHCKKTLIAIERSAPDSSLHSAWTMKARTSRNDYLSFARSVGVADVDAQHAVDSIDLATST